MTDNHSLVVGGAALPLALPGHGERMEGLSHEAAPAQSGNVVADASGGGRVRVRSTVAEAAGQRTVGGMGESGKLGEGSVAALARGGLCNGRGYRVR